MCSPVEGPRRTETSHFFNKIVGIKVSRAYFLLFVYIYIYAVCIHIYLMPVYRFNFTNLYFIIN